MQDRWFEMRIYADEKLLSVKRLRTYDEDMPASEYAAQRRGMELYRDAMHALGLWTKERIEKQWKLLRGEK